MHTINLNPKYAARTIGDSVYLSLREEILTLRLKPGEELNIKDLSASLQISRSPVRDALMRLASESMVDIFPQRGCRVSLIDLARVEQELFLREGLETLALQRFIPIASKSDISLMERAIDRQQKAIAKQDYCKLLDYDEDFHGVYFDATDQTYARRILMTHCVHYRRIRLLSSYLGTVATDVIDEHIGILDALKSGDEERCMRLEREHIHRLNYQQIAMAQQNPEYFQNGRA